MKTLLLIIIATLLSGCTIARLTPGARSIKDADATMVESCTFMEDISAGSYLGAISESSAKLQVKVKILNQAARSHATHIVWGETRMTDAKYVSLTGGAYICDTNCYFKAEEMTLGRDIEDVKKSFNCIFNAESEFPAPHDSKEKITFLQYSLIPSNCDCLIYEDFYILFHQGKLLFWGKGGDVKNAEAEIYKSYVEGLLEKGNINHVEAEKLIYEKYKQLYGTDIIIDEFFKYKIMIADKLDRKEIFLTEADYLVTKKKADIYREQQKDERDKRADDRDKRTAEFQEEQLRNLSNMVRMLSAPPPRPVVIVNPTPVVIVNPTPAVIVNPTPAANSSFNCTTSRIGNYTYTHCN